MNSFLFGCDYKVNPGACKGVFPYMPYKTTLNGTASSSSCCFECFSQSHYRVPEVTPTSTEPITRRRSLLVSCEAALESFRGWKSITRPPRREILAQPLIAICQTHRFSRQSFDEFLSFAVPEQRVHQVLRQFGL